MGHNNDFKNHDKLNIRCFIMFKLNEQNKIGYEKICGKTRALQ